MTKSQRIALALVLALDVALAAVLLGHREDAAEWFRAVSGFVAAHAGEAANG